MLNEPQAIEACIRKLLIDHINEPFNILREYGAVAQLRGLLLAGAFMTPVQKVTILGVRWPGHPQNPRVLRVQQEIKIDLSQHWLLRGMSKTSTLSTDDERAAWLKGKEKTLDIAIFRDDVELECTGNGSGDIVASVASKFVGAAIEVKASPSKMPEQKGKYVEDIKALLDLKINAGVSDCYFVLLDKSIALYGGALPTSSAHPCIAWNHSQQQGIHFKPPKGSSAINVNDLQSAGLHIANTAPSQPYVEIWTIEPRSGTWQPVRYYAY
jgi:hypothetical protein